MILLQIPYEYMPQHIFPRSLRTYYIRQCAIVRLAGNNLTSYEINDKTGLRIAIGDWD